jgi:hypothetical protein
LATPDHVQKWTKGNPEDWADESLSAARQAYCLPGTHSLLRPGAKLDELYFELELPVATKRLAQAGVRLSAMLNEIFASSPVSPVP